MNTIIGGVIGLSLLWLLGAYIHADWGWVVTSLDWSTRHRVEVVLFVLTFTALGSIVGSVFDIH